MRVQPVLIQLRKSSSTGKHHVVRWRRHPKTGAETLPEEAQQLKEKIMRLHQSKRTRFSLSYMRKRVVPPVEIPKEINSQCALSAIVAGRNVPLTRCMWDNTKRKKRHHMEQIAESYPLRCTLFR
ncbi:hypothetical protein CCR75_007923 [Bremia lactucae]|uniref:Uncharacterized protein n=1 Tax=Bremia lactucae TaxID=4779 RepID=A0A976FQR1_BRELC|nr:hypothetical protein CCR75_007923 [Bremia lactucae]